MTHPLQTMAYAAAAYAGNFFAKPQASAIRRKAGGSFFLMSTGTPEKLFIL